MDTLFFFSGDASASSSQMQTHQGNYQQQQGGSAPNMTGSGGYQFTVNGGHLEYVVGCQH
jgi:hypothetical protein